MGEAARDGNRAKNGARATAAREGEAALVRSAGEPASLASSVATLDRLEDDRASMRNDVPRRAASVPSSVISVVDHGHARARLVLPARGHTAHCSRSPTTHFITWRSRVAGTALSRPLPLLVGSGRDIDRGIASSPLQSNPVPGTSCPSADNSVELPGSAFRAPDGSHPRRGDDAARQPHCRDRLPRLSAEPSRARASPRRPRVTCAAPPPCSRRRW